MKFKYKRIRFYIYILKKIIILQLLFLLIIIFQGKYKDNSKYNFLQKNESSIVKINLIIPTVPQDFEKIRYNFNFYKKFIDGINKLVFIGDDKVEKLIKNNQSSFKIPLNFINEKFLINIDNIINLINFRNNYAVSRSGWYIQQFLKMQYCKVCQDEYYLIWDSDTIPVKNVKMFNNYGNPYFDVKTEYYKPYFTTMRKIFPKLRKKSKYSFISEHMLIKTEIMRNLINKIDNNNNISGNTWYEKIINCIDINELPNSGFSEFETYGTFVNEYYHKFYEIRPWKSLRNGNQYYNPKYLSDKDILNISINYDAISFEKFN